METTFDFTKHDEYTHTINSSGKLWIKRMSHAVAVLYFTDEMNNKTNMPLDIVVYTFDYQTNKYVILNATRQEYALCWTDDYVVKLNKNVLINIKSQRQWIIS